MVATGSHAARLDLLARRVDQVLLPQLAELDDRMDRMVSDLRDTKKASEARFEAKADRVLVQGLASRVAVLDVFDPAGLQSRVSSAESSVQLLEQLHDRVALHVRKLESTAMSKSDMTALWQEISGLRVEAQKMQKSVQDVSANSFNVAQKVSIKVENVSKKFEAEVKELRAEKASDKDLGEVSEKVRALEIAVKSSAKALSQSCGPEVNAVVKRIILGMEDKLMLLENRVQALMEGEGVGGDAVAGAAALQGVPAELSKKLWQDVEQATETVQKLKLDVGLSKADLQSVREQLAQHIDIAQRINVLVEKIAPEETEPDTSAMLTLSRVQLMIAAAARQLVAGNKWVTKEAFDYRMSEVRREVQSSSRQLMGQVEEIVAGAGKVGVIDGALSEAASPPAAAARGGLLPKVGDLKRAGPLVGGALRLHCVEELTPRSARGPGRARRAEWQHAAGEAAVLPWPGR
ncbi:unnamed protein product [Prorocentrum cordatum]|uniref:Uncharacterized protein n=1 Tax=Prorocentrum cordatum TaxID=2364126 RepID=A0ABN9VIS5_9DINO|nr:unnamed protein product [Polarella glacialis]